jgi:diguanylate cyclase (GGDEF)-like protein
VRTGRHCIVHDIAGAPAFAPWRSAAASRGYASVAAFPLHEQGRVTAVLVIYDEETTAFDDKEVEVLAESAADLAFGIVGLRTRDAHHQATETIRRMAYFDTLTGLANHEQFSRSLDGALAGTADVGSPVAVLLLDLNRLREINDAFGFDQGDAVLKEVAARLEPAVGAGGTVARMRGDEFGVLLPGADAERAEQVSQDILGRFRESFSVNGLELDISAAIGIALSPGHSAEAGRLLRHANVAMQQSKAAGLEYAVYRTEKDHDTARRLVLARELRRAIEEDQLVLYYQPKLAMDDERLLGAEALVRWGHPQQGLIPPDEFIPLAEHTGLIQPLTEWVMAAALRESARWREHCLDIPVAVNLSTRNLRDPDLQRKTEHLLTAWAAEPSSLELEITESAIMTDQDRALATLTGLNNLGIKLFVDDFGTGYSSLSYLHKLPVSAVKIDKSFMIGMPDNPDSAAIVRSTIILAHDMGLRVIAEGVEDRRTWDALAAMGCDAAQGYYISRPVPADQFNEWLAAAPSLTH